MSRIVKTANGKSIDMDAMMLKNEDTIAVGNRKVNARGDELGKGGNVVKTRDDAMRDYYAPDPEHVQKSINQGARVKSGTIGGK